MTRTRQMIRISLLILLSTLAPLDASRAETMRLSLDDAINLSLRKNLELKASTSQIDAAIAAKKQARGLYGPTLMISANLLVWDDENTFGLSSSSDMSALSQLPPPQTPYEQAFMGLVSGFATPMNIQDQITSEIQLSLVQPLTPLLTIHAAAQIAELQEEITRSNKKAVQRDKCLATATAYFRLLQAQALQNSAIKSTELLGEQEQVVRRLLEQGMVSHHQLLKLQVATAAAQQEVIKTRALINLATSSLAITMGLDPEADIQAISSIGDTPRYYKISVQESYQQALKERSELRSLDMSLEQAHRGHTIAKYKLIPEIAAMGTYIHNEGSEMMKKDSFFAGLTLSYNIWEWGATWYGIDKAEATVKQVQYLGDNAQNMIRLQVKKYYLDHQTALQTLEVAAVALVQAEEAYRIEAKNHEQGVSTASDLLEAETALAKARNSEIAARYECTIAWASLLRAMGEEISAGKIL